MTVATFVTGRDMEILAALERCPLTARQLRSLSASFARPFTTERRVRERLQLLAAAGWIRQRTYAAVAGAPGYYTLAPAGYRLLRGPDAPPPGVFSEIGVGRQRHAFALAEFLVHLSVGASREGIALADYYGENAVRLDVGGEVLLPDAAFQLVPQGAAPLRFFLEIDTGSEPLAAASGVGWARKLRLYEAFQDLCPVRFRVLALFTGGGERARNVLGQAARSARNPDRSLVLGGTLADFLAARSPLAAPCLLDHRLRPVAVVPEAIRSSSPIVVTP